jgi:ATP-dependent 26S proteasome regulatory subunit
MPLELEQRIEWELRRLLAREAGHGPEVQCERLQTLRARSPDAGRRLDLLLLTENARLRAGLEEAHKNMAAVKQTHLELAKEIRELKEPPWSLAAVQGVAEVPEEGRHVVVSDGGGHRVIKAAAKGVDLAALEVGDMVFLNREMNVIMGKWEGTAQPGSTAYFEEYLDDDRLLVKHRDETFIARAAGRLSRGSLQTGDMLRFDRTSLIAYEKLDGWRRESNCRRFEVEEALDFRPDQVGGNEPQLERLLDSLTATLVSPDRAEAYGLSGRQSVLAYGPPGCGKTLMFRVAATRVQQLSEKKCCLSVVKPGEWRASYVGETEQNIRGYFQWLAEKAQEEFVVCVLDELDGIGRARGTTHDVYDDKFLAALLVEIDGFKERGNVALCGATNRRDLLDPALYERFSDVEIRVDRPKQRAAEQIFAIHLPESTPFSPNGQAAGETRREIVARAVSRLYAPNRQDNQLSVLKFRDNSTRIVCARDLISGRQIEQICRQARRLAYTREVRGGEPGMQTEDMEEAVSAALERMGTMLTPRNARIYLDDLPQDLDVVSVEPAAARRVARRAHRYLTHS